jgi:hypothetical protein
LSIQIQLLEIENPKVDAPYLAALTAGASTTVAMAFVDEKTAVTRRPEHRELMYCI